MYSCSDGARGRGCLVETGKDGGVYVISATTSLGVSYNPAINELAYDATSKQNVYHLRLHEVWGLATGL